MFGKWREVHQQFLEVQAAVDARGNRLRIEHPVYEPFPGADERESNHYHKMARWTARLTRLRFRRCKATAVKYREYAGSAPSVMIVVSFL